MIKVISIALSLLMISVFGYSVETIVLKGGIDFEKQLSVNEIFLRNCRDFDMAPDKDLIYFMDSTYCHIFKVDMKTGKLLKTISSRGQGPSELMSPVSMTAKNNMLVVLDRGFGGIKIFAPDGKLINEFRVNNYIIGNRSIDVNDKNEIYLGVVDFNDNSMVSVYDMHGKKKRSLIRYKGDKDLKESISTVSSPCQHWQTTQLARPDSVAANAMDIIAYDQPAVGIALVIVLFQKKIATLYSSFNVPECRLNLTDRL
jgi:hypothetical protein